MPGPYPATLPPVTEILDGAGLDPAVPAAQPQEPSRWWGRHVAEVRWQAELARLLVDPVFRGEGVPHGNGMPALLIPGFMAGDTSLGVMQGWLGRIGGDRGVEARAVEDLGHAGQATPGAGPA
jgi:hypothetical protein